MKYSVTLFSLLLTTALTQSPDGTCGSANQFTCTGSPYGPCCSEFGYCGQTIPYCGGGCQPAFGTCSGPNESPDNSCGAPAGFRCHKPSLECCSASGYCGNTTAYCGGGCQSEFSVPQRCLQTDVPTNDSRCGPGHNGTTCTGSLYWDGQCCSVAGYCGTSIQHCSKIGGCQSAYGATCQSP